MDILLFYCFCLYLLDFKIATSGLQPTKQRSGTQLREIDDDLFLAFQLFFRLLCACLPGYRSKSIAFLLTDYERLREFEGTDVDDAAGFLGEVQLLAGTFLHGRRVEVEDAQNVVGLDDRVSA